MSQPGATTTNAGGQTPASPDGGSNPTPPATATPPNAPEGTAANDDQAFEGDENQWDEKTRAYIKRLRQENGKYRTKAKDVAGQQTTVNKELETFKSGLKKLLGIEKDASPEELNEQLSTKVQQSEFNTSILELALEHDIPKDKVKYFKFLVAEAAGQLQEGEEMDDDALNAIIAEVKTASGDQGGKKSTGVTPGAGKGANPAPAGGASGGVNLEAYLKMNLGERSLLRQQNEALYNQLYQEARKKRLL